MTSSTPERRYRAAEGAQDATAPKQPCAPNDRWLFAAHLALPLALIIAALVWWLS